MVHENQHREVQYHAYGTPEVLKMVSVDNQEPDDNEVRINIKAVGLNPLEAKTFGGDARLRIVEFVNRLRRPSLWFGRGPTKFPRGVARDFAGVIDAVGPNVTNVAIGDAVLGTLYGAPGTIMTGSLTQKLVAPVSDIVPKPDNLSFETAATLGVAAQTAYGTFHRLNVGKGDVIIISAASGGVGSLAVQLAVHLGATVIGIASERNSDYLRSLGAIPVAYGENLQARIREAAPAPVTKLFDCYGGDYVKLGFSLGLSGQDIGTLVPSPLAMIKGAQFTGSRYAQPGDLHEVANLVADGTIKVTIADEYPFKIESIRQAYNDLGSGHVRGKLVVAPIQVEKSS